MRQGLRLALVLVVPLFYGCTDPGPESESAAVQPTAMADEPRAANLFTLGQQAREAICQQNTCVRDRQADQPQHEARQAVADEDLTERVQAVAGEIRRPLQSSLAGRELCRAVAQPMISRAMVSSSAGFLAETSREVTGVSRHTLIRSRILPSGPTSEISSAS